MQKIKILISIVFIALFCGCDFFAPPSYQFSLFEDTPVWELVKAIKEEDTTKITELIKVKHLDVNYQEKKSRWAATPLVIAIGNNRLLSVKALLENGARQDIRDSLGNYPINHICYIVLRRISHRIEILRLLLKYGADPNAKAKVFMNHDTIPYQEHVPLMDGTMNLECTRLLIENGANMNLPIRTGMDSKPTYGFMIWASLFGTMDDLPKYENIYVAKYLIVDKKIPMPDTLFFNFSDSLTGLVPRRSSDLLKETKFESKDRQKVLEEILAYLKKEDYPKHGAVRWNESLMK